MQVTFVCPRPADNLKSVCLLVYVTLRGFVHCKAFKFYFLFQENETVKVKQTGEPVTKKRKIEDFFHKAKPGTSTYPYLYICS